MSSPSALIKVNYLVIRHLHFESVLGDLQEGNGCASRCQLPLSLVPIPVFPSTKLAFLCAFASKFFPMVVLSGSLQGSQCRVPRGAATLPHRLPCTHPRYCHIGLLLRQTQICRPICTDCLRRLRISAEWCYLQHPNGCFFAKLIPCFIRRFDSSSVVLV